MNLFKRVVASGIRRSMQACAIAICLAGAANTALAFPAVPEINPMGRRKRRRDACWRSSSPQHSASFEKNAGLTKDA